LAKAPQNVYWDSCAWLGLINEEPDKVNACRYIMREAENGNFVIWTSALSIAEVYKSKCPKNTGLAPESDVDFEDYILKPHVEIVQVTRDVATLARRLLRKYDPPLKKPTDAIHLATAVLNEIVDFHTFDRDDLLGLDGIVVTPGGTPIRIRTAPEPPPEPAVSPDALTLFGDGDVTDREETG
jgi:predicted nucleic acid-binding protein